MATSRLRRTGGSFVTLRFVHRFAVLTDADRPTRAHWQTRTVSYAYQLHDPDGREIVAYHWHPAGRGHVTMPHLHLGAGAGRLTPELTTAHLLTGAVTPVAALTLAIEAFGVNPRRPDWAAVFERAGTDLGEG